MDKSSKQTCICKSNNFIIKEDTKKSNAILEDRIIELEHDLAQLRKNVKNKECLIKLQSDQLRKMEDMQKKALDQNKSLHYAKRKAQNDLDNLRTVVRGYETSKTNTRTISCTTDDESNDKSERLDSKTIESMLKQHEVTLAAIFALCVYSAHAQEKNNIDLIKNEILALKENLETPKDEKSTKESVQSDSTDRFGSEESQGSNKSDETVESCIKECPGRKEEDETESEESSEDDADSRVPTSPELSFIAEAEVAVKLELIRNLEEDKKSNTKQTSQDIDDQNLNDIGNDDSENERKTSEDQYSFSEDDQINKMKQSSEDAATQESSVIRNDSEDDEFKFKKSSKEFSDPESWIKYSSSEIDRNSSIKKSSKMSNKDFDNSEYDRKSSIKKSSQDVDSKMSSKDSDDARYYYVEDDQKSSQKAPSEDFDDLKSNLDESSQNAVDRKMRSEDFDDRKSNVEKSSQNVVDRKMLSEDFDDRKYNVENSSQNVVDRKIRSEDFDDRKSNVEKSSVVIAQIVNRNRFDKILEDEEYDRKLYMKKSLQNVTDTDFNDETPSYSEDGLISNARKQLISDVDDRKTCNKKGCHIRNRDFAHDRKIHIKIPSQDFSDSDDRKFNVKQSSLNAVDRKTYNNDLDNARIKDAEYNQKTNIDNSSHEARFKDFSSCYSKDEQILNIQKSSQGVVNHKTRLRNNDDTGNCDSDDDRRSKTSQYNHNRQMRVKNFDDIRDSVAKSCLDFEHLSLLEEENDILRQSVDKLKRSCQDSEGRLSSTQIKCSKFESEMDFKRKENERLQRELLELKAQLSRLIENLETEMCGAKQYYLQEGEDDEDSSSKHGYQALTFDKFDTDNKPLSAYQLNAIDDKQTFDLGLCNAEISKLLESNSKMSTELETLRSNDKIHMLIKDTCVKEIKDMMEMIESGEAPDVDVEYLPLQIKFICGQIKSGYQKQLKANDDLRCEIDKLKVRFNCAYPEYLRNDVEDLEVGCYYFSVNTSYRDERFEGKPNDEGREEGNFHLDRKSYCWKACFTTETEDTITMEGYHKIMGEDFNDHKSQKLGGSNSMGEEFEEQDKENINLMLKCNAKTRSRLESIFKTYSELRIENAELKEEVKELKRKQDYNVEGNYQQIVSNEEYRCKTRQNECCTEGYIAINERDFEDCAEDKLDLCNVKISYKELLLQNTKLRQEVKELRKSKIVLNNLSFEINTLFYNINTSAPVQPMEESDLILTFSKIKSIIRNQADCISNQKQGFDEEVTLIKEICFKCFADIINSMRIDEAILSDPHDLKDWLIQAFLKLKKAIIAFKKQDTQLCREHEARIEGYDEEIKLIKEICFKSFTDIIKSMRIEGDTLSDPQDIKDWLIQAFLKLKNAIIAFRKQDVQRCSKLEARIEDYKKSNLERKSEVLQSKLDEYVNENRKKCDELEEQIAKCKTLRDEVENYKKQNMNKLQIIAELEERIGHYKKITSGKFDVKLLQQLDDYRKQNKDQAIIIEELEEYKRESNKPCINEYLQNNLETRQKEELQSTLESIRYEDLQKKLDTQQTTIEELQARLRGATAEINEYRNQLVKPELPANGNFNCELNNQWGEKYATYKDEDLLSKLKTQQQVIKDLQKELNQAYAEINNYKENLLMQEVSAKEYLQTIDDLKAKLCQAFTEINDYKLHQQREELRYTRETIEDLQNKLEIKQKTIDDLHMQLLQASTQIDDYKNKLKLSVNEDLQTKLEDQQKTIENLQVQLFKSSAEINDYKKGFELSTNSRKNPDCESSRLECETLRGNVKRLKDNILVATSLRNKYYELMEKYSRQNCELIKQNVYMKENIGVIEDYKRKLAENEKLINSLKNEIRVLKVDQEETKKIKWELSTLKETLNREKKDNQRVYEGYKNSRTKLSDNDIQRIVNECEKYKANLDCLNARISKYIQEQSEYEQQAEKQKKKLLEENAILRSQLSDSRLEFPHQSSDSSIVEHVCSLTAFIKCRERQIGKLTDEKDEANSQLKKLYCRFNNQNFRGASNATVDSFVDNLYRQDAE